MLLDTYSHADRPPGDLESFLAELRRRRVFSIAVSPDPESYARTSVLTSGEPLVVPALGVQPDRAAAWAGRLDEVVAALDGAAVVGTIGLDRNGAQRAADFPAQKTVFARLLAEAAERDLLVNVHTKAAEEVVVAELRRHDVRRVIVHWYAGSVRAFRALTEQGAYFSIGVGISLDNAARAIATAVPADRLLTETDLQGGSAEAGAHTARPGLVIDVQRELAKVRGVSVRELQEQVRTNFLRLISGNVALETAYRRANTSFESDGGIS